MTIAPGENVGPYRVTEQLGSGGMATVFKAYHASLDRYVAIKVLHPAFKSDPQFFERFKREARIVANLEHPNIIPVYDFNEHHGEPYLVMRFVEGDTLKPKMGGEPMPTHEILKLIRPVCHALNYAHDQGVVHRDIKPSNIMVTADGSIFVTDFGLARMVQAGESTLSQDMMVGTPQYISPEQAQGKSNLDGRTDIYSLGVVLYEMITGRVPFNADTPFATIHDHIYTPLPLPSTLNPDIDPEVERMLLKALAKEADDRYATSADLLTAMESVLIPQTTTVSKMKATTPVKRPSKKRRSAWIWAGVIALIFLCCLGLLVIGLLRNSRNRQASNNQPISEQAVDNPAPVVDSQSDNSPQDSAANDQQPQLARELHDQANEAMRANNYDEAAALYQQAIEANPQYLPAYYGLNEALRRLGKKEEGYEVLQTAVDNNPDEVGPRLRLGETLLRDNNPEDALQIFEDATSVDPENATAYAGQGMALLELDEDELAADKIEEALALDPDNSEAHLVNAFYLLKTNDRRGAIQELQTVIRNRDASNPIRERAQELLDEIRN